MRDSVEDLSALSRRGELDAAEQRRLQLSLQSSSEARLLHRAGLDLDLAGSMLPGDDALAERVKRRVLARVLPAATPRRRRLSPWGIAAAAACLAVAAGAGAVTELRSLRVLFGLSAPEPPAPARKAVAAVAAAAPATPPVMQAPESAASAAAPPPPQPSV
ncbi:MAG TPA: hypothetical protein VIW29_11320, partial [Polyangiaceae bacterium]